MFNIKHNTYFLLSKYIFRNQPFLPSPFVWLKNRVFQLNFRHCYYYYFVMACTLNPSRIGYQPFTSIACLSRSLQIKIYAYFM